MSFSQSTILSKEKQRHKKISAVLEQGRIKKGRDGEGDSREVRSDGEFSQAVSVEVELIVVHVGEDLTTKIERGRKGWRSAKEVDATEVEIETNLLDLVVPLQGHSEVSSGKVHIGILDEEPEALHLDEISCWRRSVLLLRSKVRNETRRGQFRAPTTPIETRERLLTLVNKPNTPKAFSSSPALNQYFPAFEFKNLS